MAEFVIIGGGVYGAAAAWALARRGAAVHLLEKGRVAGRASGGPGRRGVRANGRDHRELPLMRRAYEVWPGLHTELGAPQFYERCGQYTLWESDEEAERARAQHWLQQRAGVATEWLAEGALRARLPGLGPAIRGALYCPRDGVADHTAVTQAYAAAARAAGAVIEEGVAVARIETAGGRAAAVIDGEGRRIEVGRGLLVLANSGVAALLAGIVQLPVWNQVTQVLISAPLDPPPPKTLIGHMSRTVSLKREAGGRLMISGGWPGAWDAARERGITLPNSVAGNLAEAVAVLPRLEGLAVETADANHQESRAIDDIPVIDRPPGAENLLYAAGWSGHGWAIAPVVAPLLADWALSGSRPALLAPFALSRFGPAAS